MIRLQNLCKEFYLPKGEVKVVADNITLDIPPGVSVAVLGRNGAGKTTLLDMIGGTMRPS